MREKERWMQITWWKKQANEIGMENKEGKRHIWDVDGKEENIAKKKKAKVKGKERKKAKQKRKGKI